MGSKFKLLDEKPKVVNIGLKSFYQTLKEQGYETIHVEWKPPAGGNKKLLDILNKLK
jgi:hypothetical protein